MRGSLIFKGKNKVFRVSSPNVALLLLGGRHGFFLSRAKAETNHEIKSKRRTSIDVHKPIFFIHSFNLPSIYISIQLVHKLLQLLCTLQNEKRFNLKFTLHVSHLKLYKSFEQRNLLGVFMVSATPTYMLMTPKFLPGPLTSLLNSRRRVNFLPDTCTSVFECPTKLNLNMSKLNVSSFSFFLHSLS